MFIFAFTLLSLPIFVLLFSFFSIYYVVLSSCCIVALVYIFYWQHVGETQQQALALHWRHLVLLVIVGIIVWFCTGAVFVTDWYKHYVLFNVLHAEAWPPLPTLNEQPHLLRYALGWYMLPALAAKIGGLATLQVAIVIWSTLCLFTALFITWRGVTRTWQMCIAVLIFFCFSGVDFLGAWLMDFTHDFFSPKLQWWFHDNSFKPNLFSIVWIPQHALAAWLGTCLFWRERRQAVRHGGLLMLLVAAWSPFAAVGLLPIALWQWRQEGLRAALTPTNLLLTPLLAVPLLSYLTQDTGQIPFTLAHWRLENLTHLALFYFCEFLLLVGVLWWAMRRERVLLTILAVTLMALCLPMVGVSDDLFRRGTIPALTVLAILAAETLLYQRRGRILLSGLLLLGGASVLFTFVDEVVLNKHRLRIQPDINFTHGMLPPAFHHQYVVRTDKVHNLLGLPLLRNTTRHPTTE